MTLRVSLAVAVATGLAGCGSQPQPAPPDPEPVVAVMPHIKPDLGPAPPAAAETPKPPDAPAPVPTPPAVPGAPFRLPDDAGGKAVAGVLASPALPAVPLPGTTGPKPRSSAVERGDLPLPAVRPAVPTLPVVPAATAKPTPPPERLPADVGHSTALDPGPGDLPDPPRVRGAALPKPSAVDVPMLAAQLPSRAPVTDPTADLSAARVVLTPLPLPALAGGFVRYAIPDPFELSAHVRTKTGADGELGTAPAVVSPARP